MSLREIGSVFGVSRQRVSQIIGRVGWRPKKPYVLRSRTLITGNSAAERGQRAEEWTAKAITQRTGLPALLMPNHAPYDILVDGRVRVDVKSRRSTSRRRDGTKTIWIFNTRKLLHQERCDFFICLLGFPWNNVLVVSAEELGSASSIGYTLPGDKTRPHPSKWDVALNNWEVIERFAQIDNP